jgi:hypothetical protein
VQLQPVAGEEPADPAETQFDGPTCPLLTITWCRVRLWCGPAIAGLAEGVLEPPALSLEESRLQVIEDRVEAELGLGRYARVLPELIALARAHPGRDRLQAALMVALYRGGRSVDALASFDRLRDSLRTELGLDPSRRLRALRQAILTEDEAGLQLLHHV